MTGDESALCNHTFSTVTVFCTSPVLYIGWKFDIDFWKAWRLNFRRASAVWLKHLTRIFNQPKICQHSLKRKLSFLLINWPRVEFLAPKFLFYPYEYVYFLFLRSKVVRPKCFIPYCLTFVQYSQKCIQSTPSKTDTFGTGSKCPS